MFIGLLIAAFVLFVVAVIAPEYAGRLVPAGLACATLAAILSHGIG